MRIIFFAPNYLPATRYGGPIRSSHGLAKALVELGHEVQVFTTNVDGPGLLDVPLDRPVERDGVAVRYFPIAAPRRIYRSPAMTAELRVAIPEADVVHLNGMFLWPGPAAARIAARAGVPVIVSPRGMLMPDMIGGRSTLVKKAWIAAFERRNLREAAVIHATSDEEARGLRESGLDLAPVAVIGNGVDLPDHLPDEVAIESLWHGIPKGKRVAFLGRLDWTKGVDLAIEAVQRAGGASLLFGGPDQIGLRATLEPRMVRDDGTSVGRFLGAVEGERKWALLTGADVLLAPSVKESFGLSAAEALAVGTPVICSNGVGLSPVIAGIDPECVVARDAESLGSALKSLLSDEDRRNRIGKAARAVMASGFTWTAIAREMESVYRNAIERARRDER